MLAGRFATTARTRCRRVSRDLEEPKAGEARTRRDVRRSPGRRPIEPVVAELGFHRNTDPPEQRQERPIEEVERGAHGLWVPPSMVKADGTSAVSGGGGTVWSTSLALPAVPTAK